MNFLRKNSIIKLLLFLYILAIITVSSLSFGGPSSSIDNIDKLYHFVEYFILSILTIRYLHIVKKFKLSKALLFTILFCAIFGLSDEIHQGFVGFFDSGVFGGVRDVSIFDWLADLLGGSVGGVIYYRCNQWLRVRKVRDRYVTS